MKIADTLLVTGNENIANVVINAVDQTNTVLRHVSDKAETVKHHFHDRQTLSLCIKMAYTLTINNEGN